MSPVRASLSRAATTFVLAVATAACQTAVPSAAPTAPSAPPVTTPGSPAPTARPAAEVYAEIRAAVAQIRGLQPTADVEPVTIDEAQLRANLEAEFDRSYPPGTVRNTEDLLITLGLLPDGASLRAIILDFQSGQVAGYYSPEKDELFVVSRSSTLGVTERVTYAHEFAHQLQDQSFRLETLGLDAIDQGDRSLARRALIEGDATAVQTEWMLTNVALEDLGELLGSALDPEALEALMRAPAYLRETTIFSYQTGAAFVAEVSQAGGNAAVDAAYAAPPDSTEQIIHPELYAAREAPIDVALPSGLPAALGTGWSEGGRDTLGELILGIWLREGGVTQAASTSAAVGWGGDRVVLLRGPDGAIAAGMTTTWDSPEDAAEFLAAASVAAKAIDPGAVVLSDGLLNVHVALGDEAAAVAAALAE